MATKRLIGDCKSVPSALYSVPLTETSARRLKTRLQKRIAPHSGKDIEVILTNRNTVRRYGYCKRIDFLAYRITLTKKGENVGTLIHELAHVFSGTFKHGQKFKRVQRLLVDAYFGK